MAREFLWYGPGMTCKISHFSRYAMALPQETQGAWAGVRQLAANLANLNPEPEKHFHPTALTNHEAWLE